MLLGVNQALCWSMTVIMKVDLVGPVRRGLALGINEFAGYLAVGVSAFAGSELAAATALRPRAGPRFVKCSRLRRGAIARCPPRHRPVSSTT